jgi:predicted lipoprotein with Yx(FWY)xxD motif
MTSARPLAVLAAAALLVLVACGSSAKKTGTSAAGAASTTTVAPSTTASSGITVKTASSAFGTILVDDQGFTLYHYDKDTGTTVACVAACAAVWPPLTAPRGGPVGAGVTGLGTVTRPDGTQQVTYNGKTLYRYSKDTNPGDTTGQGVGGVWHVVTAVPATGTTSSSAATPSSAGGNGY